MALPYACGCAIAGTAIRATSRPISPSGLNTVSGFFDQFARLRRWRRHCGRRERTSVRPLALGLASLYLHQTDKKSLLSPYFAFAQYGLLSRLFRIRSIRRLGSGYVLGLAPLRAYARLIFCVHPDFSQYLPTGSLGYPTVFIGFFLHQIEQ